jgi:hypothetical protein
LQFDNFWSEGDVSTYTPSAPTKREISPAAAQRQGQQEQQLLNKDLQPDSIQGGNTGDVSGEDEDITSRPEPAKLFPQDNSISSLQEQLTTSHAPDPHQLPGSTGGDAAGPSEDDTVQLDLNPEQEAKMLSQLGLADDQADATGSQQEAVQLPVQQQGAGSSNAAVHDALQPGSPESSMPQSGVEYGQVEEFR